MKRARSWAALIAPKLGAFGALSALFVCSVFACSDTNSANAVLFADAGADAGDAQSNSPDAKPISVNPVLGFETATLDLGLGDCGAAAVTKVVSFNNPGGKDLNITLSTTDPFTISPTTFTVPSLGRELVTLSAAVPISASAGIAITGAVDVTTNDPTKPKITVPIAVTPAGAALIFATGSPTLADFGTEKLGVKATNITLNMVNAGNKQATFAIAPTPDNQFSFVATPASPAALAPNATLSLVASYTPDKVTLSPTASNITTTGVVCGGSVSRIEFSGQGVVGDVTGWPTTTLDFGSGACGGAKAASKTFTLTNAGSQDATITTVTLGSKGYTTTVTANTKVAKNNGKLDITITPPSIPFPSSVPGSYGDTLTLTTDIPNDAPHSINLALVASGAILAFDTSATPNFGTFNNVPINTMATQGFAITNTGNANASVTAAAALPFGVSNTNAINVAPNTSASLNATFQPVNTQAQTGSLAISASGLCQPLPTAIALSGQGAVAGVSITSGSLSFTANCGGTAPPQTFSIINTGNAPMTWTGKLNRTTNATFTFSPPSATLAPGAMSAVTVTPVAIPQFPASIAPSAFADFLTITTDIAGDSPHTVSFSETPIGAVLAFQPSSVPIGDIPINTSSSPAPLNIINSGNFGSAVSVTVTSNRAPFIVNTASGTTNVGAPFATSITFNPGSSTVPATASISVANTSGNLCAPLPTSIIASGRGTVAQVVVSPTTSILDFGFTNCGSTATPRTITFTNPGTNDYTVNPPSLTNGAAFTFSLSGSGIVQKGNGNSVVLTVSPKPIPQTVAAVPDNPTYSGTLTVTTTAAIDLPHVFSLIQGAQGVILRSVATTSWDFGIVNSPDSRQFNQSIRNDGNIGVAVSMTDLAPAEFGFTGGVVPPSTSVSIHGTFTPTGVDPFLVPIVGGGHLTIPSDTVLCQPTPDYVNGVAIAMTGTPGDGTPTDPGSIAVTGSLAFPNIDCNAAPSPPQAITITNNDPLLPLVYNATLANGTYYDIVAPASGSIDPGLSATVSVQPRMIVSSASTYSGSNYNDQLLVSGFSIPITQTAMGADLSWGGFSGSGDDFADFHSGYVSFNANGHYSPDFAMAYVHNSGNLTAHMTATFLFNSSPSTDWDAPLTDLPTNSSMQYWTNPPWYFRATSPPRVCGAGSYPVTTVISGTICNNQVPASAGSVSSFLYNCAYPSPPPP